MIMKEFCVLLICASLALFTLASDAAPPSTAFTYQGSLAENGNPADGPTNMSFKLWDAVSGGAQVGSTLNRTVEVDKGVFAESLDFGANAYIVNQALWLEITVDGQSMGRSPLSAAPFALNTRGMTIDDGGNAVFPTEVRALAVRYLNTNGTQNFLEVGDANGWYIVNLQTESHALYLQKSTNRLGIGTTTPATTLDVNGAITIRGGADLVEGFDSECTGANEPGTVLSIDPQNPGKLMCSTDAYDKKVAGVVSGANGVQPGIRLGQDGVMDGDIPVAMTGRVYVKASAENGAIEPGDRITTASIAGHAMKATDRDLSDGAVIGKAMTGLDEGTGLVLVLINLQ